MTEGTFANERSAIEQVFNTAWAGETPIHWENTAFDADSLSEYVQVFIIPGERFQDTIGDTSQFAAIGTAQVNIWVREGIGTARAEALADLVKNALQRRSIGGFIEMYATTKLATELEDGWHGLITTTTYRVTEDYPNPGDAISVSLTGSSSDTWVTVTTGENILGNKAIAMVGGLAYHADKDTSSHAGKVIGVSRSSAVSGSLLQVQTFDEMTEAGWAWTGGKLFVGNTGALTETRPTTGFVQQVAKVIDSNTILIDPDEPIILA